MDATYIQKGELIDYTPGSAVDAGDVIVQGELVGVANLDIAANELGAIAISGIFDFTKASGDGGITAGARCYWDAAEAVAKTDPEAGVNKCIGRAIAAAGDTDVLVRIELGGVTAPLASVVAAAAALTTSDISAATASDASAATASDAPAGGTGSADGGWDTAQHRDDAIASINNLIDDVDDIRTKFNLALDDVGDIRTKVNLAWDDIAEIRTQLNAVITALKAAGHMASA